LLADDFSEYCRANEAGGLARGSGGSTWFKNVPFVAYAIVRRGGLPHDSRDLL
jgi:hypothetical protein